MTQAYGLPSEEKASGSLRWFYPLLMLVLLIAGAAAATQYIAFRTGYHPALGRPLFFMIYPPWGFLKWRPLLPPATFENALRLGIMLFALPQIVFLLIAVQRLRKPKGDKKLHGSARWADMTEIEETRLLDGSGVYVGGVVDKNAIRYLRHNGPEHVLCFAPTRSGKGVGLILPTLLSWPGSSLTFDIKGENWALTAGYRKGLGHKALRFDPSDASGASACFNPLEEIRLESDKAIPDVQNVAGMLIDPDGKGLEDHWAKAGFAFIGGALLHVLVMVRQSRKRGANLNDLCLALADESREIKELFDEMLATDHAAYMAECFPDSSPEHGKAIHDFVAGSAREMLNKAENEASGVVSSALVNLALYRDPVVTRNTSRSDFRVHDLMSHAVPVDLYLVVSPADIDRLRPLMRLVINLIMRRTTEKMEFQGGRSVAGYKHRLLMMLDEFTALRKLDIIERAIAYCAGYGVKLYIIVQDIVQLTGVYGKDNGLMANCHVRIAYAPNNPETARLLSELTGKTTVVQEKVNISGQGSKKSKSLSVQETARSLLTPDECMRLPGIKIDGQNRVTRAGDMLIFVAGRNPIYGRQILYFKDDTFMTRAKTPAPERSDSLCPAVDQRDQLEPEAQEDAGTDAVEVMDAAPEAPESGLNPFAEL